MSPIPGVRPYELQVKIAVDRSANENREVWEKDYRDRIAAASAILKAQCNVTLKIVKIETWSPPKQAQDVQELLLDFQQKVNVKPATMVIGTLNSPIQFKKDTETDWPSPYSNQGPLQTHILLRDGYPSSVNGQLEHLIHDLAHYFGAVHSPDSISTTRADLNNGLANSSKFHISFDPLNLVGHEHLGRSNPHRQRPLVETISTQSVGNGSRSFTKPSAAECRTISWWPGTL